MSQICCLDQDKLVRHLPFTGRHALPAMVLSYSKAAGERCERNEVMLKKVEEPVTGHRHFEAKILPTSVQPTTQELQPNLGINIFKSQ